MPTPAAPLQQFVVLPTRGLRATAPTSSPTLAPFLIEFGTAQTAAAARSFVAAANLKVKPAFRVLDAIHEDGAKLVEMSADVAKDLLAHEPGLRIVPVVYYRTALVRYAIEEKVKAAAAGVTVRLTVTVVSKSGNTPVKGATVVAFTDFAERLGAQGTTNSQGVVKLSLGTAKKVQRLYVYTTKDFWGALQKNVSTGAGVTVKLEPVALNYTDALRHFYGKAPDGAGAGVKVAVVDTGVGPHADLVVEGGENTVVGEQPGDFGDNGDGHGTHVGGIVAARGTPPSGIRGLAPSVTLRSYRVFGKGAEGASNYSIAKAIDRAVTDGCDVVNLSLGGADSDPATQSAVHDARERGTLVVAAAGNDDRGPVIFPAADPLCLAVSALGRKGTFPKGAVEEGDVVFPFGTDSKNFIGAFSNVGSEVDLTAPGVGILSTVPGGYAPMSGTSMACPAVTGFAARLLAGLPQVLALPRTQGRSDAIAAAVLQAARSLGFAAELEGRGIPR